ncbi:female-specific lacrimal gland protein-like [Dipodomys merriami]|uniref:female-specific lacrimal gland protein-like n=1 Tax=Dipodomys merriami TaxID=94247 RepID=UPI003855EFCE
MKALLLALIIGVVCADNGPLTAVISSQVLEQWNSIAIASDDEEKISEGGPLRIYIRHFECIDNCEEITFTFYVKSNGECQKHIVAGKRNESGIHIAEYAGKNSIEILQCSKDLVKVYNVNVDEEGKTTHQIFIAGKGHTLSKEQEKDLEKVIEEKHIRKESVQYLHESDTCPR